MDNRLNLKENVKPLIEILTWFFLIASIFGVILRAVTKFTIIRVLRPDDILISIALLFSITQSVAVSIQCANGFGHIISSLSPSQISAELKAEYAANFLYILSLCFAKLAVLALIRNITPLRIHRLLLYGLGVIIIAWAATAEFVTAFQCRLPRPWDYINNACFDRTAWWTYFEVFNLITDMALILLPFLIVWTVQTPLKKKASVLSFFSLRVMPMAATICKIVFWTRLQQAHDLDPTFDLWPVSICTQCIQCLEIIAASCLYLRPLLDSLDSGFMRGDDLRRRGESTAGTYGSGSQSRVIKLSSQRHSSDPTGRIEKQSRNKHTATVKANVLDPEWDAGSQHSRSQIIRETRTWTVESTNATESVQTPIGDSDI